MSEISAIELEAKLRQRAVELSIQSFGSYIHSTSTKDIRRRSRKLFDFLSGQDVNGVIQKAASERIDALVKDFESGNVTVEKAETREDITKNFVESLRSHEAVFTYGGRTSELNRRDGEPVLSWFRRINPDGNNEYPVVPFSVIVELMAEVQDDPDVEVEIYQNPGSGAPWVVSALSRVI